MFTNTLRVLFVAVACSTAVADELAREIVLTRHEGTEPEDVEIVRWQERAGTLQATAEVYERLAWAYVAKARRSLDAGFYKLAEKTITVIDDQFGPRPESRLLRGHVLHNLHRFHEAGQIAQELVSVRGAPVDWALLSDALIEQGKVREGATALQRFVDLKPGMEAYGRISYVRWLHGDLCGAMTALDLALRATHEREKEPRAWLWARLSALHLQMGDHERALACAVRANELVTNYAPALLARGRALLARQRIEDALVSLRSAERLQPLPEYQWWLADALRLAGNEAEAGQVENRLAQRGAELDPRTTALFLATRGMQLPTALRLAERELHERQDVFTHDARAWCLFAIGDIAAAEREINAALAEGTKDARLFQHAGEIAAARRDARGAERYFSEAHRVSGTLTPSERSLLDARLSSASLAAAP